MTTRSSVRARRAFANTAVAAALLMVPALCYAQDPGPAPPAPPGFAPQPPPPQGEPFLPPPPPQPGYPQQGAPGYPQQGYPPDYSGQGPALPGAQPKTYRDLPETLPYEEGDPVPYGYRPDTRIRKGLVIGGAVTLGSLYLISASFGSLATDVSSSGDDYRPLYVPVLGPFITINTADSRGSGTFFLLIDGVGQSAGLAMLIAGLAAPKSVLVRNDIAEVHLSPVVVGDGQLGLGFAGTM